MANPTIRCRIVTPTQQLLDEQAVYISVPAWDGLFGVQPGAAPLVAQLGSGELRVDFPGGSSGGSRSYFVESGFVRLADDELIVLADEAIPAENIIASESEAEVGEADRMSVDISSRDALEQAERKRHAQERSRAKLAVARKHRGKGI